jgi:hypothetical protein
MIRCFILSIFLCMIGLNFSKAQTVLNANSTGTGDTYTLINSVLAPGYTAIEASDQTGGAVNGTHPSFGKHIAQVYDADLAKYVLEFYAHVAEDNDITGGLVRQRVEIKTYTASPNNLKGSLGETVIYKWKFKIPVGFQPSSNFTHIHQIKAVDGDDSSPIFTLTPRKGSPNKLELIYAQDANSGQDKKVIVNLSDFEGNWVEATETIKIAEGTLGTYAINIKKLIDGVVLLSYSNNNIQTIRTAATDPATPQIANTFIRPKWGIYRSLNMPSDLRDESIRFSDISIQEITALPVALISFKAEKQASSVQLKWNTDSEQNNSYFDMERSTDGKLFDHIGRKFGAGNSHAILNYFFTDHHPIKGVNYYRLKQVDLNGNETIFNPIAIDISDLDFDMQVFSNPNSASLSVFIKTKEGGMGQFLIYNLAGQKVFDQSISLNKGNNNLIFPNSFKSGIYISYFKKDKLLVPHQIML